MSEEILHSDSSWGISLAHKLHDSTEQFESERLSLQVLEVHFFQSAEKIASFLNWCAGETQKVGDLLLKVRYFFELRK